MPTYVDILYWFGLSSAVKFGKSDQMSFKFPSKIPAIFDTGTSYILVPKVIATEFFTRLTSSSRSVLTNGLY